MVIFDMKNVKPIIEMFLKFVSARDILHGRLVYGRLSAVQFVNLAMPNIKIYTENELENIYAAIIDMVSTECEKQFVSGFEAAVPRDGQSLNFYGLLLLATKRLLQFNSSEIVCQYRHMLDWRQLTVKISEDTFTTAFCAVEDLKSKKKRTRFDWPSVIGHNNFYLNKLLQQELSDNHFHLWASSPHFNLSWIRIMNDTDNLYIRSKLSVLNENKQNVSPAYYQGYREDSFETMYLQAALIRVYLYSWLNDRELCLQEYQLHNQIGKTILVQIEEGLLPDYAEMFHCWRCGDEKSTWLEQMSQEEEEKKREEKTKRKDAGVFLKNLEEKGIEIPRDKTKSFKECLEQFLKGESTFPLWVLEPIMKKKYFGALWRQCTEETVEEWLKDERKLQMNSRNIQLAIDSVKRGSGLMERIDYALWELPSREQSRNQVRWELCGERYFLYRMFQRAYQENTGEESHLNLFYAYLVIKEKLRSEIIQSNDRIGFRNFQKYDRRKGMLIEDSAFENTVLKMAIEDTLSDVWLKHLEVRIVPRNTVRENVEYIRMIDQVGSAEDLKNNYQKPESFERDFENKKAYENKKLLDRYYYVYHFVKEPDDTPEECYQYSCRHERKRAKIKRQACCITGLREQYPREGKRVLGIDACSMEIGCRPEVFAQAFRYLKGHCVIDDWKNDDERELPQLRVTYHVGEDFLDIVDGMRAIDEAVHFLNLNCGDRLGHVLALGIDVKEYYKMKRNVVCLPKQEYLDNLAWIYNHITKYRLGLELNNLRNYVEREFSRYFSEVYGNLSQKHNYNIRTYFEAWELRGDKPAYYKFGRFCKPAWHTETEGQYRSYESYAVNYQYPKNYKTREIEAVAYLYHAYHYDKEVKIHGREKREFDIPECWVEGVEILQQKLQQEIAHWGISIESNPTSNYMISGLGSYEKHPIVKWYNHHLTQDPEKLAQCPQLSVSINTDDKGCFSTSLENEYALMACALEQAKDENGEPLYSRTMIYGWLDEIRQMGNLQSFQMEKDDA